MEEPESQKEKLRSLYVIRSEGGICKIGISYDPEDRLRNLLCGHGLGLELVHVEPLRNDVAHLAERAAHKILEKTRTNGEWFKISPEKAIHAVKVSAWIVQDVFSRIPKNESKKQVIKKTIVYKNNVVHLPHADSAIVHDMRKSGVRWVDISSTLKVSESTARRRLKAMEIKEECASK